MFKGETHGRRRSIIVGIYVEQAPGVGTQKIHVYGGSTCRVTAGCTTTATETMSRARAPTRRHMTAFSTERDLKRGPGKLVIRD